MHRRRLPEEIGRSTDATKRAYIDGLLIGTLQHSPALADQQLADEVLEQGIQNALALLGTEHQS